MRALEERLLGAVTAVSDRRRKRLAPAGAPHRSTPASEPHATRQVPVRGRSIAIELAGLHDPRGRERPASARWQSAGSKPAGGRPPLHLRSLPTAPTMLVRVGWRAGHEPPTDRSAARADHRLPIETHAAGDRLDLIGREARSAEYIAPTPTV